MANRSYLLNTRFLCNDQEVLISELLKTGAEFVEAANDAYRIPIPWFCCFRKGDLQPATLTMLDDDDNSVVHNVLIPCAPMERALENLVNSLPLFLRCVSDPLVARAYWQDAVDQLRRLPLPFLTMNPMEIFWLAGDIDADAKRFAEAFSREANFFTQMCFFSGYDTSAEPYEFQEFSGGLAACKDMPDYRRRLASSAALHWGGGGDALLWYVRLPAAATEDEIPYTVERRKGHQPFLTDEQFKALQESHAEKYIALGDINQGAKKPQNWWQYRLSGVVLLLIPLAMLVNGPSEYLLFEVILMLAGLALVFMKP